jgi:HEPN domain-containing protein
MSDARRGATVPAAGVHSFAFNLYRLETELTDEDPDAAAVLALAEPLTRLQGVPGLGTIGDDAEHFIEYFLEERVDTPEELRTVSLSTEERTEVVEKVREWIDGLETHFRTTVARAPTTELGPDQVEGTHEMLKAHVGQRFEPVVRDLNEATTSLCAGSYTSAEFMCVRAAERTLRVYFRERLGEHVTKDWSRALDAVVDRYDGDLPEDLQALAHLRQRRERLSHPESHSSRQDAEHTLLRTYRLVDQLIDDL